MLKNRKSVELSVTLIITVVIALIVLVVALAIFGKGTGESAKTLRSCEARGGHCTSDLICQKGESMIPNVECEDGKPRCCLQI